MKKLTKVFLSVAAVTAVSAAMAASAMAMTASYADGTLTLGEVNGTGASQTILVLSEDTTVTTENANAIVKQIDQKDDSTVFKTVPVGTLADGTYYVRIGGTDGSMQEATFTVGGGTEPTTKDVLIGDVDINGNINPLDAVFVARKAGGATDNVGQAGKEFNLADSDDKYIVGDIDVNGQINPLDAIFIARKSGGATDNVGQAGNTVKVVVE